MKTLKYLLLLIATSATAQTNWQYIDTGTPHTNAASSRGSTITIGSAGITNASYFTTNPAAVTFGDPPLTAYSKANSNFMYFQRIVTTNMNLWVEFYNYRATNPVVTLPLHGSNLQSATVTSNAFDADTWFAMTNGSPSAGGTMDFDSSTITSDGSGNITAVTVKAGLKDSASDTGTYGYSPVANGDGTWSWMAMVTITNTITNTVTAYNLSNAWLGSQRTLEYSTNYAAWGASNFLARVNGLYSWQLEPGNDGGNPPMNIPMSLVGSYNGTNGWFTITNGFKTTNQISVAAITNGYSARGSARATLGQAKLYSVDKWELLDRDNHGMGQSYKFDTPVENDDAATKGYVDTKIALALNGQMTTYGDTNDNSFHTDLNVEGSRAFGITKKREVAWRWMTNDATGLYIHCPATNLASGYTVLVSTNLALAQLGFSATTNFTAVTNGTEVIITVAMSPSDPMRFIDILTYSAMAMQFDIPTAFAVGTLYPSNTWSLASITNGMRPGDIITVNSNGLKLVDVWMSNSTPILKPRW